MSITAWARIVLGYAAATVAVDAHATHPSSVEAAATDALKLATTLNSRVSRDTMNVDPVRPGPLTDDRKRHDEGRRLQIVGGLVPSANIAAQAGALDPRIAALTAAGESASTGVVPAPDVHIEPSDTTPIRQARSLSLNAAAPGTATASHHRHRARLVQRFCVCDAGTPDRALDGDAARLYRSNAKGVYYQSMECLDGRLLPGWLLNIGGSSERSTALISRSRQKRATTTISFPA